MERTTITVTVDASEFERRLDEAMRRWQNVERTPENFHLAAAASLAALAQSPRKLSRRSMFGLGVFRRG